MAAVESILTELQIRESEERFRLLVESAPYAIVLTDELGDIRLVNRQTEIVFGYDRGELIGKSVEILLPENFRKKHVHFRQGYYKDSQVRPMGSGRDLHGLHKLGTEIPVEIGLAPIYMQGKLLVIATIVDIRERRKNEEQILQKNKELAKFNEELKMRTAQLIQSEKMSALGTLIAGVAHELNNPITGILNYSQYCRRHVNDPKVAGVLDDLIYEARRCEEIIKNLLQYSHPNEAAEADLVNSHQLEQVIKRVCNLFAHELKDIQVHLFIDSSLPGFKIALNKLQQIFSNIIKNAMDAMETSYEKKVTIRAFSDNSHCHLVVEDTGVGIEEENILRIFDPFYTTKEVGKGTGLGLAITKSIVDDNNGEIDVYSKKNKETQFHIKFPKCNG
jgi:PAS domain S-box-containing protein